MNPLDPNSLVGKVTLGWLRHIMSGWLGYFVGTGLWSKDQENQALTLIMGLIVLFLSAYDKYQAKPKPPQTPPDPSVPI